LKILHLSHNSLPDWRIEKAALTAKKEGHDVLFVGHQGTLYENKIFTKIYSINWKSETNLGIFPYWYHLKKQIEKILKRSSPDIIHAHNIVAAKMASQFKIPYIYDNHEYASLYTRNQGERKLKKGNSKLQKFEIIKDKVRRRIVIKRLIDLWTRWEIEVTSSVPTITVSNSILTDLKNFGTTKKIFVVPNYPLENEILFKEQKKFQELSSVYAGSESDKYVAAYRNIDGFTSLFEDNNIGKLNIIGINGKSSKNVFFKNFLPRSSMFNEMANCSIGIIPWKKHWSHKYLNPNKAYEYAYSGLLVLCISDLSEVINTLQGYCDTFNDYSELVTKLKYYQNNLDELFDKRKKGYEFAKKNLIWENYEKNILNAYKLC
jgi:glycosyltransferase involved in cell wall biosynthesis